MDPGRSALNPLEYLGLAGSLILLDAGAAELVRWSGGLSYIIDELGAALAVDLQDELILKPGTYKKACVLLTSFVWEFEHAISKLARVSDELIVLTSLSSEAHANHPQVTEILGEVKGDVFSMLASQLATLPGMTPSVRVAYLPLHIYNLIGPGPKAPTAPAYPKYADLFDDEACEGVLGATAQGPPVFVTCSHECCRTYPIQLSDLAASSSSSPPPSDLSQVVAEDIPMRLRVRYRMLAYALAGALKHQLRMDVKDHIFALGKTSALLGSTLGRVLETDTTTVNPLAPPSFSSPGGLSGSGGPALEPASIVLIDRTLDTTTALAQDLDSLLQKVATVLPRTGPRCSGPGRGDDVDAVAQLHDVGVNPPHLIPVLDKHNPTPAFPALAAFPWQAPPSLCHPCDSVAGILVKAMASVREPDAHIVLRRALNSLIEKFGCPPPPPKRRGPGAEIMALIQSLSSQGLSICHKCRAVLQIALAVVETLQRTKDSTWDEVAASQKVIRQSLLERPDDVVLTGLLIKCLESQALSLQDCLSLCLFARALHGDTLTPQLRLTLRDGLVRKIKQLVRSAQTEEQRQALRLLPYDLVKALSKGSLGSTEEAALDMELRDVVEEDFLLRFEETAQTRRRLQTASLRELVKEDPRSECVTLVGRLTNLLLTGDDNELDQLGQDVPKVGSTLQQLSRVGFGLLASGIGKLGGVLRGAASSPAGRPNIIIFVVGGLTYQEVREVSMVVKASKLVRSLGASSDDPRRRSTVMLGSTCITTPEVLLHRTLSRHQD